MVLKYGSLIKFAVHKVFGEHYANKILIIAHSKCHQSACRKGNITSPLWFPLPTFPAIKQKNLGGKKHKWSSSSLWNSRNFPPQILQLCLLKITVSHLNVHKMIIYFALSISATVNLVMRMYLLFHECEFTYTCKKFVMCASALFKTVYIISVEHQSTWWCSSLQIHRSEDLWSDPGRTHKCQRGCMSYKTLST